MKKILFLVFILAAFLFLPFIIRINLAENLFVHHSPQAYPLSDQLEAAQSFIPSRNGLVGLEIRFKKINDLDHRLRLELAKGAFESEEKPEFLSRAGFNSAQIEADKFYPFYLPSSLSAKGEEFFFRLRASGASQSASVSPIISNLDIYLQGQAYLNGQPQTGDLVFKPVYRVSLARFISFYVHKIAFNKPKFLGKIPIFGLVFLLGFASVSLLISLFYYAWTIIKDRERFLKASLVFGLLLVSLFILYYTPKTVFFLRGVD